MTLTRVRQSLNRVAATFSADKSFLFKIWLGPLIGVLSIIILTGNVVFVLREDARREQQAQRSVRVLEQVRKLNELVTKIELLQQRYLSDPKEDIKKTFEAAVETVQAETAKTYDLFDSRSPQRSFFVLFDKSFADWVSIARSEIKVREMSSGLPFAPDLSQSVVGSMHLKKLLEKSKNNLWNVAAQEEVVLRGSMNQQESVGRSLDILSTCVKVEKNIDSLERNFELWRQNADPGHWESYRQAQGDFKTNVSYLNMLVGGNESEMKEVFNLRQIINRWMSKVDANRKVGSPPALNSLPLSQARTIVTGLFDSEKIEYLQHLEKQRSKAAIKIPSLVALGSGVTLLLLLASWYSFYAYHKHLQLIKESRDYAGNIISSSIDMIISVDLDRRITEFNRAAEKQFGYKRSQVIGRRVDVLYANEDQGKDINAEAFEYGQAEAEVLNVRSDGSIFNSVLTVSTINDATGKVIGLMGISRDVTERRQMDEALRKSQEMLQLVMDNIPQFIFWKDRDLRYLGCNKNFANAAGLSSPEEIVGLTDFNLPWHKEVAPVLQKLEEQVIKTDMPVFHIFHRLDAASKESWLDVVEVPMHDDKGVVVGILGTYEDITQKKKAEEALKLSQQRLKTIVDNAPIVLYSIDVDGIFTLSQGRGLSVLGLQPGEVVGKSVFDLYKDVPQILGNFKKALGGIELRDEVWLGSRVFESWYKPLTDDEGKVLGVVGVANDITARKQAESSFAAEKERLSVTLRSIADGVVSTDTSGRIILINKAAEQILGYSAHSAEGQIFTDLVKLSKIKSGENEADPIAEVFAKEEGVSLSQSARLKDPQGLERTVFYNAAPVKDSAGHILGAVVVIRDITEQLKREEESRKKEKLESIGVLAGGIAHDFNNILTAVIGNISLAALSAQDKALKRLQDAEKACMRARDLSHQLLTFAKGGAPVKRTSSIGELIRETALFAVRGSKSKCEFSIPLNLRAVDIDRTQVSQVIENLTINADQAMPNGGQVFINCENVALSGDQKTVPLPIGDYVRIIFRDTGVGISPENLKKIFDPYFTTKTTGNGLGLATTYSIIKNHEGFISVESSLGKGTSFIIYLPASKKPIVTSLNENQVPMVSRGEGRVLVMDDEDAIRDLLDNILTELGYQVTGVKDGDQAIAMYQSALLKKTPFDVVIMDLTIPGGMGGEEAIKKLTGIDPKVKAIVSSGYATNPVMSKHRDYGFKGVIAKPYKLEELSRVLSAVVNGTAV